MFKPKIFSQRLAALLIFRSGFHVAYSFAMKGFIRSSPTNLYACNLDTAFEWLAEDRENEQPAYSSLFWLDPSTGSGSPSKGDDSDDMIEMPLYPISATYIPSKTTHILNNVKPRNIQMVIDLAHSSIHRQFCVALSCTDTGRIAAVGTVMSIVDFDVERVDNDEIRKIRVTCRPEAAVDIKCIVNPEVASWESKIREKPEYLKAKVQYRKDMELIGKEEDLVTSILEDYTAVRQIYLKGTGSQNMLPSAVNALDDALPEWTSANFGENFWESLEKWQTLCNTVRENRKRLVSIETNELMVAGACAKGGPLKLPIHMEDLPPEVQREIRNMEVSAQLEYFKMGMDPCLDYQVLLSLPAYSKKLEFFSTMISKERKRLESMINAKLGKRAWLREKIRNIFKDGKLENQEYEETRKRVESIINPNLRKRASLKEKLKSILRRGKVVKRLEPEIPRKGAWFDDAVWDIPETEAARWVDELPRKGAWFNDTAWDSQ